jgi:uncharacterized protein YqcC (DUF446 family)
MSKGRARKPPDHAIVARHVAAIEAEMRRLGLWQDQPLPPEALRDPGAFGMNTMTFPQWLQFVLIPNVRQIIAVRGQFPERSMVGVMAVRNFDGMDEADGLTSMLSAFDALIEGRSWPPPPPRAPRRKSAKPVRG